jgi:uncharacterized BrkB/YihY/UPF0761 family membrane protein
MSHQVQSDAGEAWHSGEALRQVWRSITDLLVLLLLLLLLLLSLSLRSLGP